MAIGLSTTQTPYIIGSEPNVRFTSILSVGDSVGFKPDGVTPWRMVGIPDGLGAFDNGDGTMTMVMNHEIGSTQGVTREHGSIGSFVSRLTIDKATLQVTFAEDAIKTVQLYDETIDSFVAGTSAFNRFCSGDLAKVEAFYDAASGLGTQDRIYLTGEEAGAEGRLFATVLTGAEAGTAYELDFLGNFSWENAVASPNTGVKTLVIGTDDSSPGQVYVYVGDKQATGNAVEKAGLVGGDLYGIKVAGLTVETNTTTIPGGQAAFTLEAINGGDVSDMTGAGIETASDAAGVTEFFRPEDGVWDVNNPNRFYFVTTASVTENSRLYALDFTDINNPTAGGTITLLLEGNEGHRMLDNMTINADGKLILQEDPGNNVRLAKVWEYDPVTDKLVEIAQHDPARFGTPPVAPFNQDEESSGAIDVTSMLGDADTKAYLVDVQAHYNISGDPELVQGGQLMVMYVDTPTNGGAGNDTINGDYTDNVLRGFAGDDAMKGGSGNDTLRGDNGHDVIDGGSGADKLYGGTGDDTITGGLGDDVIDLGSGDDTANGGDGFDTITGGYGMDTINGGDGGDTINSGFDADTIDGGQGADTINGGEGDDIIFGGLGDDKIFGGIDDDKIHGGSGADQITGGSGADIFFFDAVTDSSFASRDIVKDFARAQDDKINLSAIDAISGGGDDAFTIVSAFSNTAGELLITSLNAKSAFVQGDVNGDGAADFTVQVNTTFTGGLIASDFVL